MDKKRMIPIMPIILAGSLSTYAQADTNRFEFFCNEGLANKTTTETSATFVIKFYEENSLVDITALDRWSITVPLSAVTLVPPNWDRGDGI